MDKYNYAADDHSLLSPPMYKFLVNPFMKILPMSIPANIITLFSNSLVLLAFLVAYFNYLYGTAKLLWLIPVLCLCYTVGDFSDGLQARRTGTGSPLGEFFDHFLDSFVTGFITGIFLLCFRIKNPLMIFMLYQFLYIGQIGTFWERLHLKVMKFFKISTTEGIVSISVFSSLYAFAPIRELSVKPVFLSFTIVDLMVLGGYLIAGYTGFKTIFQTKKLSFRLFLHLGFSAIIGAVLAWQVYAPILLYTIVISFYNVFFITSILDATASDSREKFPDIVVPVSCILFFIIPEYSLAILIAQSVYLFAGILIRFQSFFKKYKHCWYWKNPKIEETGN